MKYLLFIVLVVLTNGLPAQQKSKKKISREIYEKIHAVVEYTNLEAGNMLPVINRLSFSSGKSISSPQVVIEVHDTKPAQVMDGIGGAFNEQGWVALSALPADKRRMVLWNLFDTKEGANLRFNRIPVGT